MIPRSSWVWSSALAASSNAKGVGFADVHFDGIISTFFLNGKRTGGILMSLRNKVLKTSVYFCTSLLILAKAGAFSLMTLKEHETLTSFGGAASPSSALCTLEASPDKTLTCSR